MEEKNKINKYYYYDYYYVCSYAQSHTKKYFKSWYSANEHSIRALKNFSLIYRSSTSASS